LIHSRDRKRDCQEEISGHFHFDCVIIPAVSKKTKKQKIIADRRRQATPANQPAELSLPKEESIHKTNQTQTLYLYPTQLIRKDLTKTLALCILAISFEIALYLSLEKNLILPFGN